MGLTTDGMSPADLAAVTGNNNGAFGEGNGAWWIIILFLFIFCGWGNGNGWNNGGGAVAVTGTRQEDIVAGVILIWITATIATPVEVSTM